MTSQWVKKSVEGGTRDNVAPPAATPGRKKPAQQIPQPPQVSDCVGEQNSGGDEEQTKVDNL